MAARKKTENFAADNKNWGISNQSFQHNCKRQEQKQITEVEM